MTNTTQTIEKEVKRFEIEVVALFEQLKERQQILDVYVNLFNEVVNGKISSETFESILDELIERHNKLLPLAINDADLVVSELNIIGAFESLFELREVMEIIKQIKRANETLLIHVHLIERSSKGRMHSICTEYSIDTTELEGQYPKHFDTNYLN